MSNFLYRLRTVDLIMGGFAFLLLCLSVFFHKRLPDPVLPVFKYAALIAVHIVVLRREGIIKDIVFPVIYVFFVFDSLGHLVHYINPKDLDPLLIRLDYRLFGGHPTVMLEAFENPLLTEFLRLAYCTYYLIPLSLGAVLKTRGKEEEFQRVLFLIVLCFILSFAGYILTPALGPRYAMEHLQGKGLPGLLLAGPIDGLLNSLEGIKRDAFPSGHVAITLLAVLLSYRYERVLFFVLLPVGLLLTFSTVYLRYHYAVDVLAGIALGAGTLCFGERLYRRKAQKS